MLIIVKGKPKALKRHRHRSNGFTYDPSSKDKKKFAAKAEYAKPDKILEGALRMQIVFYMPRPKKDFRTGRHSGRLKQGVAYWHTYTPDLDNMEKFVGDSLEGIFYKNDSQIAQMQSEKIYCNPGEETRTEINITQIDEGDKE
jgi:Holliday junction resolvase RusA-like endonuclease